MFIDFISVALLVLGFVSAILTAIYLYINPPYLRGNVWITSEELGTFEERISGLREVILVADKVDIPTRENASDILIALIDNFAEGVTYNFILPRNYVSKYGDDVYQRYRTIMDTADELSDSDVSSDQFNIYYRPNPEGGSDYPFLFYRYKSGDENKIVAYRGNLLGQGIAEYYRRLEPETARSFLRTALAHLTQQEGVQWRLDNYENFAPEDESVDLDPSNSALKELINGSH